VSPFSRVILIVLDSVGIGELPDAARYGDQGSDTLGNIASQVDLALPHLARLGLGNIRPLRGIPAADAPHGSFGRMAEASPGKDSVTGHWEIAGIVLDRPFPTFPEGFPAHVLADFEARIGRGTLGNRAASGTTIIEQLGDEHVRTGHPIVYTSADSVFQIAAHEDVVPVETLYRFCEVAYALVGEGMGVGRVIARPFTGTPGQYTRTARRHDFALPPPAPTLLDRLSDAQVPVHAVGKVADLFAGRGIATHRPTVSDADGLTALGEALQTVPDGLIFANLVDCDQLYGHRNDVAGYARNLEQIDAGLGRLHAALGERDLLVITADHGNDPTTPSTDHSREYVPLLLVGPRVPAGTALGTRSTFADLGQTLADLFGVASLEHGTSMLPLIARPVSS
jgi:phosphopentomutase